MKSGTGWGECQICQEFALIITSYSFISVRSKFQARLFHALRHLSGVSSLTLFNSSNIVESLSSSKTAMHDLSKLMKLFLHASSCSHHLLHNEFDRSTILAPACTSLFSPRKLHHQEHLFGCCFTFDGERFCCKL